MLETERLCQGLYARHINYVKICDEVKWEDKDGCTCRAVQRQIDSEIYFTVTGFSAEKILEFTAGREKCKIIIGICSRCGALIHESANMYWQYLDGGFRTAKHKPVNYCPNCGREVEQ